MDATSTFCRDCLTLAIARTLRCAHCGSPRLAAHPEMFALSIAHIDCDAFYAAIEKRDDASLGDKPVIIGGGRRGVVLTACYIARTFGVRSAMPMFTALKACPHAVIVRPNMEKYAEVGRSVRARMLALTPAVEPLSIDEAFIDLSGTERLHGLPAALVLARFQQAIEREVGISVSIGLSHNKFLAKIASDLDKPRGFAVIGRAETLAFLAGQPIALIWGVGPAMQARLARDGLTRIAELQKLDASVLRQRYGAFGGRLWRLARGEDVRAVRPDHAAKTISAETTLDTDAAGLDYLLPHLRALSERVSSRLKARHLTGATVILKLKTSDFRLRTRNAKLAPPTNLAGEIFAAGRDMLRREALGTRFRLIGIGVSGLAEGEREAIADLLDPKADRHAKAEHAMDAIRQRFGPDGLALGLTYRRKQKSGDRSA